MSSSTPLSQKQIDDLMELAQNSGASSKQSHDFAVQYIKQNKNQLEQIQQIAGISMSPEMLSYARSITEQFKQNETTEQPRSSEKDIEFKKQGKKVFIASRFCNTHSAPINSKELWLKAFRRLVRDGFVSDMDLKKAGSRENSGLHPYLCSP